MDMTYGRIYFLARGISATYELEDMMNPVATLLMTVFFGSIVLMTGIVIFRESGRSISDAFKECLAWGADFFVAMSMQVLAIATLS